MLRQQGGTAVPQSAGGAWPVDSPEAEHAPRTAKDKSEPELSVSAFDGGLGFFLKIIRAVTTVGGSLC